MTNAPACPRCGAPAAWKAQANGWGCDRCQQMLATVPVAAAPVSPACPRCGGPGVWHAQAGRWGCDRCRGYLDQLGGSARAAAPPQAQYNPKKALALRRMGVGGLLLLVGIIITVATHDAAERSGGGTYIVAYGPIVVGSIRFLQGLFGLLV